MKSSPQSPNTQPPPIAFAGDAPPPSVPLVQAVNAAKPVRLRRPALDLAVVVATTSLAPIASAVSGAGRPFDTGLLWQPGALAAAALWATAAGAAFTRALVPRRGEVLPDATPARRATVGAIALATGTAALLPTAAAPVASAHHASFAGAWLHCAGWAGLLAAIAVTVGALTLRRALSLRPASLGAALGAAGAALAGLDLHLRCPYGGTWHLLLAHAGAVALAAVLGAAVGALMARLRR